MNLSSLSLKTCFLFDFDGTLVDSSSSHEKAFLMAMSKSQPALQRSFSYEQFKGFRTEAVFRSLGVEDKSLLETLTEDKQTFYRDQVELGAVQLIPSALELLRYLADRRRRLFVVTSASRKSLSKAMERTGIEHFFEHTVSGDDVSQAKPAPDCYLRCLELAGVQAFEAVAIEDATAGIESAQGACLDVVAVNNPALASNDGYVGSLDQFLKLLTHQEKPEL